MLNLCRGMWNSDQTNNSQGSDSAASLPIAKLRSTAQLVPFFWGGVSGLKERRARPGPGRRDSEALAEVDLILPAVGWVVPYPGEVLLAFLDIVCFMDHGRAVFPIYIYVYIYMYMYMYMLDDMASRCPRSGQRTLPGKRPWCFYDLSMGLLWDVWGNSMGIPWDSYGVSLWFLCYFHVISTIFLWDFCGIPMGFLW